MKASRPIGSLRSCSSLGQALCRTSSTRTFPAVSLMGVLRGDVQWMDVHGGRRAQRPGEEDAPRRGPSARTMQIYGVTVNTAAGRIIHSSAYLAERVHAFTLAEANSYPKLAVAGTATRRCVIASVRACVSACGHHMQYRLASTERVHASR